MDLEPNALCVLGMVFDMFGYFLPVFLLSSSFLLPFFFLSFSFLLPFFSLSSFSLLSIFFLISSFVLNSLKMLLRLSVSSFFLSSSFFFFTLLFAHLPSCSFAHPFQIQKLIAFSDSFRGTFEFKPISLLTRVAIIHPITCFENLCS